MDHTMVYVNLGMPIAFASHIGVVKHRVDAARTKFGIKLNAGRV
jgi:hypothetical protein